MILCNHDYQIWPVLNMCDMCNVLNAERGNNDKRSDDQNGCFIAIGHQYKNTEIDQMGHIFITGAHMLNPS